MVHPVLAYFLDKKHQQQNVPGFKYKSPVQIAGPDHLLQIQTCKAELFIFPLTKNAQAFLNYWISTFSCLYNCSIGNK
jgi:hypothetical protein